MSRGEPHERRPRIRRHHVVGFALVVAAFFGPAVVRAIDYFTWPWLSRGILDAVDRAEIALWVLSVIWWFWIVPFIDSADPSRVDDAPRRQLRSLRLALLVPVAAILFPAGVMLLFAAVSPIVAGPILRSLSPWLTPALVLMALGLGVAAWLWTAIGRRLRRSAAIARRCFHCGYDLRGLAERRPCPECGDAPDKATA